MTNHEKLVALVKWARDSAEAFDAEFGSGRSYAELVAENSTDAILIEAAAEVIMPEETIPYPPYDH